MSEILRLRTPAEIEDEAAAWVWRMDAEEVSAADRQSFEAWLRRDPRHRRALEEMGGVWRALDGLAEAKRDEKIATFANVPARIQPLEHRGRRWLLAAVASIAAMGITAFLSYQRGNETQAFATAVGQQRSLTLADGSVVQLNTNTMLETHFMPAHREVFLGKGEAHFRVAHDSERPFRVHAGAAIVRAVGTEFDVRVHDDRSVEVIVTEGRVQVLANEREKTLDRRGSAEPERPSTQHELDAGQRLVSRHGAATVTPIDMSEAARALAWRDGAVVFDAEPLARAVTELNRYTETRFVISDPRIGELRIGGRYRTNDVEGIIRGLESALPISIRRTDDGLIYIEPRH
jgi:transmembrane sensor